MQLERGGAGRSTLVGEEATADLPAPVLHWGSAGRARLSPDGTFKAALLTVAAHGAASLALEAALGEGKLERLGVLLLPEHPLRGSALASEYAAGGVSSVWGSPDGKLIVVFITQEVAPARAHAVAAAILDSIDADRTLVLDELLARDAGIPSDLTPTLRWLRTATDAPLPPLLPAGSTPLESGAVVAGVAAALLGGAQLRYRAAGACLGVGGGAGAPERSAATQCLQGAARECLSSSGFGPLLSSAAKGRNGAAPPDPNANLYL